MHHQFVRLPGLCKVDTLIISLFACRVSAKFSSGHMLVF